MFLLNRLRIFRMFVGPPSFTWSYFCHSAIIFSFISEMNIVHCEPGYEDFQIGKACTECALGYYKSYAGAGLCSSCPSRRTTSRTGSISEADCLDGTFPPMMSAYLQSWSFWTQKMARYRFILQHVLNGPDSKIQGTNWGPAGTDGTQVGPM